VELQLFDESKFNQAVKLASTLAKSTIVPMHFRNKPEEIFAALVMGAELGFQPMQSLNSIVLIQGSATLKASTMLALARAKVKDLQVEITEKENEVVVTVKRNGDSYIATWNDSKAAAMGLLSKDNYKKQKMTMFRWRGISEALRIICPDILQGLYSAEEMDDLPPIVDRTDPAGQLLNELRNAPELDFPIPPEEKAVGPLYRFQNSIHRGKQLFQVSTMEIEEYLEKLNKRTTPKKPWELELQKVLSEYLENFDQYKEMILELTESENE
jgi:hypothetical protein